MQSPFPMSNAMRTFRARDTAEALASVKAALGSDAVIVATREVRSSWFARPEIEVTAALAHTVAPELAAEKARQAYARPAPALPAPIAPSAPRPWSDGGAWAQGQPSPTPAPPAPPAPPARAEPTLPKRVTLADALLDEVPLPAPLVPPGLTPAGSSSGLEPGPWDAGIFAEPAQSPIALELSQLRNALDDVRREVRAHRAPQAQSLPPVGVALLERLTRRGVEQALALDCVKSALDGQHQEDTSTALLLRLKAQLATRLPTGVAPWERSAGRRVLALVGPTGVGKTTTVAKIAARAHLLSSLKVAMLTLDTYRIGATEQIARYGNIMRLPTRVVSHRKELDKVLHEFRDMDLVLIDTAGRSARDAFDKQADLLRAVPDISMALVVSAAAGALELTGIAERYRPLKPEGLIVTKLDEAYGPGSLLSASARLGRPVVAVTNGQQVPEDIHPATPRGLVELILGVEPISTEATGGAL